MATQDKKNGKKNYLNILMNIGKLIAKKSKDPKVNKEIKKRANY